MMKLVTKERVLKAHDRLGVFRQDSIQADSEKIKIMAMLGMKTLCNNAFGVETPRHEFDRVNLELQLIEKPLTAEDRANLVDRWTKNLTRRNEIRDKIEQVQVAAGISGLVRGSFSLGDREFPCWDEHPRLSLIESDLEALRSERDSLVNEFLRYCIRGGLKSWRYWCDDWAPCDFTDITTECQMFDWIRIWEDKSYTSPKLMKTQGFDTLRSTPVHDDDRLSWSVHIEAGRGTDRTSGGSSIEFCCSNRKPRL